MKLLTGLLLLFATAVSGQTIPNASFETWGLYNTWTLDPQEWFTGNFQVATNVYPDSAAYEGEVAMQVTPFLFFEPIPGLAFCQIYDQPVPETLSFAVKCNIDGVDSVYVRVVYFGTDGPVVATDEWSSSTTIENWQEVTMSLSPPTVALDRYEVHVVSGYGEFFLSGSPHTWISVDAMAFDQELRVPEFNSESSVYPNPSVDLVNIRLPEGAIASQVVVYDALGKEVMQSNNVAFIHVAQLKHGIYFMHLTAPDGSLYVHRMLKI
ncbi:MAG: T9SS type A sorting domain-containing protein [Cryomorphaceae bacterium]|nr:T9SS type A sorting domain-containing protein [Cryomorphaceae bacterium]